MSLPELSAAERAELDVLLHRIETVGDLEDRGQLIAERADLQRAHYLQEAADIAGAEVAISDLVRARQLDASGSLAGLFDLIDIVWASVAVLLLVALIWLITIYVVPLIRRLPPLVHEVMLHAACLALLVAPWWLLSGGGAVAVATTGCLGLIGALGFSFALHLRRWSGAARALSLVLCGVWALTAVAYGSPLIGGLAVIAWLCSAGAWIVPVWGVVHARDAVAVSMCAALTLLVPALALRISSISPPSPLDLFQPAALALTGTVYLAGCLVLASRHHPHHPHRLIAMQALAIGSGAAAVTLGTLYGVDALVEAGGTFFALYLLEKFFEIPWRKHGYAWMCLLLAGLLYAGASFAERHPELFLGL